MGAMDVVTVASGGTYTPDPYGKGDTALVTMSGNITIASPASGHRGGRFTLILVDTSAHTITWQAGYVGTKPTASVNGRTIVSFYLDGVNYDVMSSTTS